MEMDILLYKVAPMGHGAKLDNFISRGMEGPDDEVMELNKLTEMRRCLPNK